MGDTGHLDEVFVTIQGRQQYLWRAVDEDGDVWVANYYSARNPLRLSSLVILGVVARMFRCATRSSCWCT